ncbi:DUF2690 domain-containing protein [Streptomyces sp. NPDC054794]
MTDRVGEGRVVGHWRPLPGDLPIEAVRLVRELRLCLDRCESGAATVALRTGYSRSSWRRYVNGSRLPPWPAVEALGRVAHADREQLRVMWESAALAWQQGQQGQPRQPMDSGPEPGSVRPLPATLPSGPTAEPPLKNSVLIDHWAVFGVAVLCMALAAVLCVWPWQAGSGDRPPEGVPTGAPAWPYPLASKAETAAAGCRSTACEGLDPDRERCDDDRVTVHRLRAYGQVLELLYSPACQASWAEARTVGATARLRIATRSGDEKVAPAGAVRTAMIAGGPGAATATVVVGGHQLGVTRYDSWIDTVTDTGSR